MSTKPNYRNLTSPDYGKPKKTQNEVLQNLIKPHIESFNCLLHEGLGLIVQNLEPVEFALPNGDKVSLKLEDVIIGNPRVHEKAVCPRTVKVYPVECRSRAVTYKGSLQIQIGFSVNGHVGPSLTRNLGQVPIMVKSAVCNLAKLSPAQLIKHGEEEEEMGGYFIINGIEKVIRMLVLPRRNFPMCVQRPSWKGRGPMFTDYGVMMRCVMNDHSATNLVLHYLSNGTAQLCFYNKNQVYFAPIIIILKGLVSLPDRHIYEELVKGKEDDSFYKGCIVAMLREALNEKLFTRQAVLKYIGSRFRFIMYGLAPWKTDQQVGRYIYKRCICTHLDDDMDKFNLLVHMTRKLFDFAKGRCASESQDSPMFQEVLLGGHFYQMLLKSKLGQYLNLLKVVLDRHAKANKGGAELFKVTPDTLLRAMRFAPDICHSIEYTMATGNIDSSNAHALLQTSGLTVVADKLNFMRYMSHFRCVHRGAFFGQMRTTGVRKLLPEAWGFLCPVHTPDGAPCGLMNHAAANCQIQVFNMPAQPVNDVLYSLGVFPLGDSVCPVRDCYIVMLDGKMVGYVACAAAERVSDNLRRMKVMGLNKVPSTMEICLVKSTPYASQYPGLYLFTTPARMLRPVRNLGLQEVEMIGTFEQVYMDICIRQEEAYTGVTTHLELTGVSMLSFAANLTPFSDFNQSPRNMYQCQMGKQTMGVPVHTLQFRNDNKLYKLQTPQTPIVRPTKYDDFDIDNYPLGTNAIVAVISYTGYDMEDAMVINKGSLQRGFGHASVYKTEIVNLCNKLATGRSQNQTTLVFGCTADSQPYKSGQLNIDGLPPIGTYLTEGSPYYSYLNTQSGESKVVKYKSSEPAWVEHIKVLGSDLGDTMSFKVAIMLRINRNPIIGDKFASRHGQKGVCSMLYPTENMPFSESGMTPDIIFNPHGYPSRMTIGMMIESMAGKAAATFGDCYDATPFQFSEEDPAIDHFGKLLTKAGYNYYGTERFYSGVDGRELEADIFMGVVYYQRLRHMVSDKFQVRTTGPVDPLTNQPVKGRKKHGGVRFGEMERDALIAHGSSFLLQDRLFNCSDKTMAPVCIKCGNLLSIATQRKSSVDGKDRKRNYVCSLCKSMDTIQFISVPFVFKYLLVELAAMNIRIDLQVKEA
ncbi:DNA-directed RNA polymerase I subunit RPA2-like [Dreissena polymorpha]|uniref:DNA-directed RNA polymerase I subunit RPA2-like n=1 Tax=Dreissena polymorpha TaxID=45954 RepID=UPI0022655746|nr:DNA-directed RNA polymerase I subunit RPA2-like [Dreissena polymorpha]